VAPWEGLAEDTSDSYHLLGDINGGALGVLSVSPMMVTTEVIEEVNGGPLAVLPAGPVAATTEDVDVDGGPSGGAVG
jgi:hypothetical protein